MEKATGGPLAGVRVVEIAGLGPGPFCGMMLADMGSTRSTVVPAGATPATRSPRTVTS
jgi:crotonobetainyl-CoA:carnitine CoA-transferase CaiB-like acyl-CoA transferase